MLPLWLKPTRTSLLSVWISPHMVHSRHMELSCLICGDCVDMSSVRVLTLEIQRVTAPGLQSGLF
eukprot:4284586-Amphidinium_carterae.1